MKKVIYGIIILATSVLLFYLAYDYKNNLEPKSFYKVYLNNEVLGVIDSKDKLQKYINKQSDNIKNKYNVDDVYAPAGLQIEYISSYNDDISSIESMFDEILDKSALSIEGYQISIKTDDKIKSFYVTKESIFKESVEELIKTFVGEDRYLNYKKNKQSEIVSTGRLIENVYIQDNITIKKLKISVNENIFSDATTLTQFLLYGDNHSEKTYNVVLGDTISTVAFNNHISVEELLLSNSQFTDMNNLLHQGQQIIIAETNPQLKVVLEEYVVSDKDSQFVVEERYDPNKYVGDDETMQQGENGLIRVSEKIQTINGAISYIDPLNKKELKPTINKIIIRGKKIIPSVGDTKNWSWPTNSGYTISDNYSWRINPITGNREHHSGIDIAGTGYGSNVYAANNGTVVKKEYKNDYGYYLVINHNNGYWTVYAHLSKFAKINLGDTVSRGQIIGYVGSSGWSTGPHLHFEVWKGKEYSRIYPMLLYQ